MLATPWPSSMKYIPPRPSPLSPRSANASYRPIFSTMSASNAKENAPFFKRAVKPNPLIKGRDEQRERRRDLFMKKVEQGRDEKRWEGRSDQILRSDYMAQRRREEAQRALSAPDSFPEYLDEEEEQGYSIQSGNPLDTHQLNYAPMIQMQSPKLRPQHRPGSHHSYTTEEAEVDAVAQMEELELQELIGMAEPERLEEMVHFPSSPTRYGSDEEEYDDIFMEILSSQDGQTQQPQQHGDQQQRDDGMDIDMSNG